MDYGRRTTLERIIEHLEKARTRPAMFITSRDPRAAQSFILGFSWALAAIGFDDWGDSGEVATEHGYGVEPTGILPQMERRGFDKAAIVNELFEIEIEGYRRALRKLVDEDLQSSS